MISVHVPVSGQITQDMTSTMDTLLVFEQSPGFGLTGSEPIGGRSAAAFRSGMTLPMRAKVALMLLEREV